MLLTPAPARRRRALAHACATCHRPWALRALRSPDGVYRLVCRFCSAGHDAAGARTTPAAAPRDHELLLAADDADLVRSLADLVEQGLSADEPCVVIATAPHRDALREHLGADVLAATARRGAFVELDAADTLQLFLRGGRPDAALFDGTVGAFLRDQAGRGRVRAYGEMVGLLWSDGRREAALELEALWNGLCGGGDLSLRCGYDGPSVDAAGRRALGRVHSAVA